MSGFGERMRWVTCVTPLILWTDIHDDGFRVLSLDLEGGGERIFSVYDHPVGDSFEPQSDGKLHWYVSSIIFPAASPTRTSSLCHSDKALYWASYTSLELEVAGRGI
jgi:hypothetical protein